MMHCKFRDDISNGPGVISYNADEQTNKQTKTDTTENNTTLVTLRSMRGT